MTRVYTVLYPSPTNFQRQETGPQDFAAVVSMLNDLLAKLSPVERGTVQIENWPAGPVRISFMKILTELEVVQKSYNDLASLIREIPEENLPEALKKWKAGLLG
jgi:hypothetical protein